MTAEISRKRKWWVPEVVQTSSMDCGPAVLKCLLDGYGIPVDYGRLREACQTGLDGTSIDVLEQLAGQLGLSAEQVMLPVDHLLLAESEALPAILVVRLPNGFTHFILVWRRHGDSVQIMDPAVGRRWVRCRDLVNDVYVHLHRHSAGDWREWASSDENRRPMLRRISDLGLDETKARALFEQAATNSDWRRLATLDAATRMTATLIDAGGVHKGDEAQSLLLSLIREADADPDRAQQCIPDQFWSVTGAQPARETRLDSTNATHDQGSAEELGSTERLEEDVMIRGAVMVRVLGRMPVQDPMARREELGAEVVAAMSPVANESRFRVLDLIRGAGVLSVIWLFIGMALAAGGAVFEGMLLRGAIGVGRDLGPVEQRVSAVAMFVVFICLFMFLELTVSGSLFRLGRLLEASLRMAFLEKIPRLVDRYFQSRPISDMSERSHSIQQVRLLPELAGKLLRSALTLAMTAAAISWIEPAMAPFAWSAVVVAIVLPLMFNQPLQEIDVRFRTHTGALTRFYLDALLGLTAIRSHGGERPLRREHEGLLVEWARVNEQFFRMVVLVEGLQMFVGFSLSTALLLLHASRGVDFGATLLLAYWALQLPVLAEEVVQLTRRFPMQRNLILRLLEPLGAPVEARPDMGESRDDVAPSFLRGARDDDVTGVSISLKSVTVKAAGHTILQDVDLDILPGSHVAIVGPSGAGKSSLVGLLLGWHRAATGQVLIDNLPLDASRQDLLREQTAWVDPAVQLWNRSLLGNLLYGAERGGVQSLGNVLDDAHLYDVLERLPDGLQTPLGEGGGLVSGGEGQRVRFGRALVRQQTRLAILDEPFRGLDREQRRDTLHRARQQWRTATLLCVTHDVRETNEFERVLVIEAGRIVEDGTPNQLAADPDSRYSQLLKAEDAVRQGLWAGPVWRRLSLAVGSLQGNGVSRS